MATLVTGVLACSSSVLAYQDLTIIDNEVNNIASAMLVDTPMKNGLNLEQVKAGDIGILQKFDALSVSSKYEVLNIVREENFKKFSTGQNQKSLLIHRSVDVVMKQLKSQGLFIGDLYDSQIKALIVEVQADFKTDDTMGRSQSTASASSSCPLKNFHSSIDYAEKPTYTSYASAYYYSNVVTTVGEYPCDTELWYNVSKSRVYGLNFSTRQLITSSGPFGYSGRLSKRTANGDDRIVIGVKKYIWGLSDYALSNNVVIW